MSRLPRLTESPALAFPHGRRSVRPRAWARPLQAGLLAATACVALPGCSVGPRYRHPDPPVPAAWRTPEDPSAAQWPASDWWRGFKSTPLEALISGAEQANDDLGAAVARVAEADAQVRIAGAALLPSLDATGAAAHQHQVVAGLGPNPVTANTFSAEFNASYLLDFWGRNRAALNAARYTAEASRYDRETIRITVLTSVASSYFQALEARDRLEVAEHNLVIAQRVLRGLTLEQTVGTATALDVAQQATTVATLSASIPPLRQQLGQTLDALAVLVGQPPEALELAPGTLAELAEPDVSPGLPSELLARRPDVAEAEAQLRAANANIVEARAAFFPSISLTADGGYASAALGALVSPATRVYDLGVGVTQPIFQGGALLGQYRYTQARYRELLSDYHKAVLTAFSNAEDALIALRETGDQLQRQQEAASSARRAFELSQAQFKAGTINILTLLNTETALFSTEDALLQVKYLRLQALVNLFSALGGGWTKA
jgi:NodT family efflux transporter outer membrane factor (OMF) lipoprotein